MGPAHDIDQLVRSLQAGASSDKLTAGKVDDLLPGDGRSVIAASLGAFSDPIGAVVRITGDRLIYDFHADAGSDTAHGNDGNDTMWATTTPPWLCSPAPVRPRPAATP